MSQQTVKCEKCGREIMLDKSRTVAVGGGATPVADRESEIMCPDCRVVTRFSDENEHDAGGES
jgi:phage FluMu protein Com